MNKKAFTLIELLVVVLIIAILAAVAVPQYQKAVATTRWMELETGVRKIAQAQEMYYLANGSYNTDFKKLDVELDDSIALSGDWAKHVLVIYGEKGPFRYLRGLWKNPSWRYVRRCYVKEGAPNVYHEVCKKISGVNNAQYHRSGWYEYHFREE